MQSPIDDPHTTDNPQPTDVLIVGGGPVGLTTALLLARLGLTPIVVERHPATAIHPRARGLNVRTMEIFRGLGLEPAIRAAGAALADNYLMLWVESLAGRELRRLAAGDPRQLPALRAVSPSEWAKCAQDELEPVLLAAAREAGALVRFSHELVHLTQDDAGVDATIRVCTTGELLPLRARYVVATDGSRSPLRHALAVPSTGPGVITSNIGMYFRARFAPERAGRDFILCFVENPDARGILLSVNNDDRWVFNTPYDPAHETPASFTRERCGQLIRAAIGRPDLELELLSVMPWDAAASVADSFQVGRVFLAGDAAHTMPPAGAFGLNTGVADAHNLAWKLAAVLSGAASPALLASYDAERRPVALATVANAVEVGRQRFAHVTPGATHSRAAADPGPPRPATVDDITLMLGPWYASTAIVDAGGPFTLAALATTGLVLDGRPGTRAPHLWIEQPGAPRSTLDLFGRGFVLLASADAWCHAARTLVSAFDLELTVHRPGADLPLDPRTWAAAYGVGPEGAVLVRPDGIVAWRSEAAPTDAHAQLFVVFTALLG